MNQIINSQDILNVSSGNPIKASFQYRVTLDTKGRVRYWCIWNEERDGVYGVCYTDFLESGKVKTPTFKESKPKNVGKANETTSESQAIIDLNNQIGIKERNNYFRSVEEAKSKSSFRPMLAHKFEDHQDKIPFPRYSQPKLDGARCNVYWSELEGKVVAKTRTGKDYYTTDHIIRVLGPFCETFKDLIFDGELYNHAYRHDFEKIMSLARQSKPNAQDLKDASELLEYHIYDVYSKSTPNATFEDRTSYIAQLQIDVLADLKMIHFVPTNISNSQEEEDKWHDEYLEESYEGQMIRNPNSIYKVDGRSQDLLKRKVFTDEEFPIVAVEEGEANWKGCAKRIIIELPDGRTQGCGIDGSYEVNRERFENRESLVGKLATVRYFRLTKDGMLYIPVCKDIDRHD